MHPTWSLPSFAIALTLFNLIVVLVHAFDADVVNHRSVLLDFVGQGEPHAPGPCLSLHRTLCTLPCLMHLHSGTKNIIQAGYI